MKTYNPNDKPKRCTQVNAFIRAQIGAGAELIRGNGYFYFADLCGEGESSVYVNQLYQMTYAEWLNQYKLLCDYPNSQLNQQ